MLEALLRIIERFITLRQGRVLARKELFRDVLAPTFDDLLLVHGDYLKMFENVRVFNVPRVQDEYEIVDRTKGAKEALRARRLEFAPVREKIRGMSEALALQDLKSEEKAFVDAVVRYFPSGEPSVPQSSATAVLKYLEQDLSAADIDLLVTKTLQRHVNAWSDVCTTFAGLKVAVTKER